MLLKVLTGLSVASFLLASAWYDSRGDGLMQTRRRDER
jgi:hypothetical protein